MTEPWVNAAVVAEHLNKSVYTIYQYAKAGIIPGAKLNNRWAFQLSAIDDRLDPAKRDPWAQSAQSRGRRRTA